MYRRLATAVLKGERVFAAVGEVTSRYRLTPYFAPWTTEPIDDGTWKRLRNDIAPLAVSGPEERRLWVISEP